MLSFKEVCELPENGFEVVACTNAEDGMELFENFLEDWAGVILDAKVYRDRDSQVDDLSGFAYSLSKIQQLYHKRRVPYYIFTGQPDTASASVFAEEHKDHYYEKAKDDDKLIEDIKANAKTLIETQIIHKYPIVFDTWPESRHDLLRILKVLEDEDWQNNSVLNDIRKIMSDVMNRMYERGILSKEHDNANLAACSIELGQRNMVEFVPVYVQRAIHTCVDVTNPGSHRSDTDMAVQKPDGAPYLLRSLIYNMLDVLYWCKDLPPASQKEITARRVELSQRKYNKQNSKN